MSEKKKINDDMVFQSFSKNYVFESNKDNNKTSHNENFEFSFKKNLFLQKSDENNNSNKNLISSKIDHTSNIYSKNDRNIQESGHFGRSKYDSKDYREIIEKNALKKQPIFYIEEKFNRMKEEEEENNVKNTIGLKSNNSNSSLFSEKMKKIQIIRKKKSIKNNNSINYNRKKQIKDESFSFLRNDNANDEKSYLYKKKITNTNNNINLNNIINIRDISYDDGKINKTFYKNNTINVNDIRNNIKYNKYEFINLYRNNIQNIKTLENNRTTINGPKLKAIKSNYILKRLKENKENNSNNYKNIIVNNLNTHNIFINNNNFCPNFGNIKFINIEPDKTYSNIYKVSKYSNKIIKNENMERIKNEFKIKKIKRINNLIPPTSSHGVLPRNRNIRYEKENNTKILNNNSFANSKLNTINNKSIGLYKTRTHHSKLENKKMKKIPNKKVPDKIKFLKERIMNWYPDKMNF